MNKIPGLSTGKSYDYRYRSTVSRGAKLCKYSVYQYDRCVLGQLVYSVFRNAAVSGSM